jgi:hypothetical protein
MVNGSLEIERRGRTVGASGAICLTASPRSQQELRIKPSTSRTQNQREQLARFQIVVVDRRTMNASRKERPSCQADLSTGSTTRCRQGLSQLLPTVGADQVVRLSSSLQLDHLAA